MNTKTALKSKFDGGIQTHNASNQPRPKSFPRFTTCFALASLFLVTCLNAHADTERKLGELLYRDKNLSINRNQSCASCHGDQPSIREISGVTFSAATGFVDPENVVSNTPVSRGSVPGKTGGLNAPSAAYAAFSPIFHWNSDEELYVGGQFWNGRAKDLQAQAAGPFLNPGEMGIPNRWAFVARLKENPEYQRLFDEVFGINLEQIPDYQSAASNAEPEGMAAASAAEIFAAVADDEYNAEPEGVAAVYDAAAQAVSEYERSPRFNKFNSKFDFWLAGKTQLSSNELHGMNLFNNKAGCAACHPSEPSGFDRQGHPVPPMFTDFTYDNIGLPRNTLIPGNPEPDLGLGGRADIASAWPSGEQKGKHKVPTLRNVAVTAPYGHNGVFKTLEEIVHFYNTRDVLGDVESVTHTNFGISGWPVPEVPENVNQEELGNLGLTAEEETAVVAFMKTLTDDYSETGADDQVPPGTASPFALVEVPQIPTVLEMKVPGKVQMSARLGKYYQLEYSTNVSGGDSWQVLEMRRFSTNGVSFLDKDTAQSPIRLYRAAQLP